MNEAIVDNPGFYNAGMLNLYRNAVAEALRSGSEVTVSPLSRPHENGDRHAVYEFVMQRVNSTLDQGAELQVLYNERKRSFFVTQAEMTNRTERRETGITETERKEEAERVVFDFLRASGIQPAIA